MHKSYLQQGNRPNMPSVSKNIQRKIQNKKQKKLEKGRKGCKGKICEDQIKY